MERISELEDRRTKFIQANQQRCIRLKKNKETQGPAPFIFQDPKEKKKEGKAKYVPKEIIADSI